MAMHLLHFCTHLFIQHRFIEHVSATAATHFLYHSSIHPFTGKKPKEFVTDFQPDIHRQNKQTKKEKKKRKQSYSHPVAIQIIPDLPMNCGRKRHYRWKTFHVNTGEHAELHRQDTHAKI